MSHCCRLHVEELDQRILPSNSPSTLALPSFAPVLVAPPSHALAGQGEGTYSGGVVVADAGQDAVLRGGADLASMGHVTVTGMISGPGFVVQGHAWGSLTFSNAQGSVSVALEGPLQVGFSPLPQQFSYRVQSVSGGYLSIRDHGTLTITWHPARVNPMVGSAVPRTFGMFTLTIAGGYKPPQAASGIDGVAIVGPLNPLPPPPGVPDSAPLPGAVISIQPANGGAEITHVTTDAHGRFTIKLPAGRYLLVPVPRLGGMPPFGESQVVVVHAGQYTHVTVNYDSGIA